MKHVFFSHSWITLANAECVASSLNLRESNIVTARTKGRLPGLGKVVDFHANERARYNPRKMREIASLVEDKLSLLVGGDDFVCYFPHLWYDSWVMVIKHHRCKGYYFIEEGVASYAAGANQTALDYLADKTISRSKNWIARLAGPRGYPSAHRATFLITDKFRGAFVWNRYLFPFSKIRLNIGKPRFRPETLFEASFPLVPYENTVASGFMGVKEFVRIFDRLFEFLLSKGVGGVNVKFHPSQKDGAEEFKLLLDLKKTYEARGFFVNQLPSDTCMEAVLSQSCGKMPVFFLVSSVGLYAHLFGGQAFSLLELAPKEVRDILRSRLPAFLQDAMRCYTKYERNTPINTEMGNRA